MKYFKNIADGHICSVSTNYGQAEISKQEHDNIVNLCKNAPVALEDYQYKLRADNLEWELVKLPPVETETLTDEEALTRYANELTGANDPDLISAAETLIEQRIKENGE